jgi:hypothetical protein
MHEIWFWIARAVAGFILVLAVIALFCSVVFGMAVWQVYVAPLFRRKKR